MPQQSKYYVFTVNNPTDDEKSDFAALLESLPPSITYIVIGKEIGESGTPHYQGYVEFKRKKRLNGAKNIISRRGHFEARRGTAQEASDYCKKDGNFIERGELSKSQRGRRTDLLDIKKKIDEGADDKQIADEYFGTWCIHRKALGAYRDLSAPPQFRGDLQVFVLWGESGVGKSRFAWLMDPELWPNADPDLKWFDGYRGESTVLLDDYRGSSSESFFLRVLDIYPLRVPVKGSFVAWNPHRIWITSNKPPPFGHDSVAEPVLRRITKTVHFSGALDFEDPQEIARVKGLLGLE